MCRRLALFALVALVSVTANAQEKWKEGEQYFVIEPAQDVWMLVPSSDHEGKRQRELFIEAYRQFRPFSDSWLRLVEPLRALRYIHYTTWIARRWEDPSFKQTFTHFGEALYWEREVQDLREQIARIDNEIT